MASGLVARIQFKNAFADTCPLFSGLKVGLAAVELIVVTSCFWKFSGQQYLDSLAKTTDSAKGNLRETVLRMPAARVTWLCAVFLLGYVGVEVSLGGWIVEFMIQVRKGEPFASGMAATGFWLGITVGRLVLGFVTPKIGENRAIIVSFSSCNEVIVSLLTTGVSDLPTPSDRLPVALLAGAAVHRGGGGGGADRAVPRPAVPVGGGGNVEVAAAAHACGSDWVHVSVRWRRSGCAAIRGGSHRSSQGRAGAAAHHPGSPGRDPGLLARHAEVTDQEGIKGENCRIRRGLNATGLYMHGYLCRLLGRHFPPITSNLKTSIPVARRGVPGSWVYGAPHGVRNAECRMWNIKFGKRSWLCYKSRPDDSI